MAGDAPRSWRPSGCWLNGLVAGILALASMLPASPAGADPGDDPAVRPGWVPGCQSGSQGPPTGTGVEAAVRDLLGEVSEHYGVVLRRLDGAGAALNPDRVFYAASLYKLAVMYELFRQSDAGQVSFDEELAVTDEDAAEDLGTLEALGIAVGDRLTVAELLRYMIVVSDNASAIVLGRRVERENVDAGLRELGLVDTSLSSPSLPTTADDMARLLEAIAANRAVSEGASEEMAALLRQQALRGWLPAGLPEGVAVGNKTGSWFNAAHDAAIVWAPFGTYVLAILSDLPEESALLPQISGLVFACLDASGERSAISNQGKWGEPGLTAEG